MNALFQHRSFRISLCILLGIAVLLSLYLNKEMWKSEGNLHLFQARSWLNGRLDIPDFSLDAAPFGERFYVPFPPFPSVILLPHAMAPFFSSHHVILVSFLLSILNFFVFRNILQRLQIEPGHILWLTAAFFLGTGYWMCVCWSNGVWYYALIVSVTCALLALREGLGSGRGLLAGLFLGLGFLSRQLTIYAVVFFVILLWTHPDYREDGKKRLRNVLTFLGVFGLAMGIYLFYNHVRFGDPLDTGYDYMPLTGYLAKRVERFGLFHPVYFPYNFVQMFLQGFHIEFDGPTFLRGIHMNLRGTSLTFASPFLYFGLLGRWKKSHEIGVWITILCAMLHMLFYYSEGAWQINTYRSSLDFLPYLMLLVAMGIRRVPEKLWKSAILYSIFLNILALVLIPLLNRIMG